MIDILLIIISALIVVVIVLLSYIIYSVKSCSDLHTVINIETNEDKERVCKMHPETYRNVDDFENSYKEIYSIGWNGCKEIFKERICKMYCEASRNGDGKLISKYLYRHLDDYFDDELID